MQKKTKRAVWIAVIVALCFVVGYGIGSVIAFVTPCVDTAVVVRIPSSAAYPAVLDSLRAAGIRKVGLIDRVGRLKKMDENFKRGYYRFDAGTKPSEVINLLRSGDQTPVRITFNNIRSLEELASRLSRNVEADSAAMAAYLKDPATAARYGFTTETFMGMFIPDTYEVWWTLSPESLVERLNVEYSAFWNDERTARAESIHMNPNEVATLASIVYSETKAVDEMPRIAGVYMNRLRRGIPLQADPTVIFAVGDPTLRRVLRKHTSIDSPYNTYKYRGLPPAPICMPSKAAIDAVLGYEHHNFIYFCAKEDFSGKHNFASTLREHNRNAQRYARTLDQAGIK